MARCEYCGKPITTEEFETQDGICTNCATTAVATASK